MHWRSVPSSWEMRVPHHACAFLPEDNSRIKYSNFAAIDNMAKGVRAVPGSSLHKDSPLCRGRRGDIIHPVMNPASVPR